MGAATDQYTQRTVDIMYGAFLEKDSAKDCQVPSKDSNRARDMPTYSDYQKETSTIQITKDLKYYKNKILIKINELKSTLEFVQHKYQCKGQTHIFRASSLMKSPHPAAISNQK